MSRKAPGKTYCKYSKEALINAIEAVKNGTPCATAAKTFGVPRITLHYKVIVKFPIDCKSGVDTILSCDEENLLASWIIEVGKTGFPVSKEQLLDSVALLVKKLNRPNTFKNGRPGRHWYEGFLKRHPQISIRITQNLTSSRAAVSEQKIREWFQEIQNFFIETNVSIKDPRRIFNADEVGFSLAPKGKAALIMKGSKSAYNYANANEKESITTLVTANAAGELAPPMIMFAYERLPKHIVSQLPDKWGIGKSDTGWMTSESFYEYIANVFYPWIVENGIELPIILYVDGHKSHLTMNLSDFCTKNGIILLSFVPNATHVLQPLDIGYFHPLKSKWGNAVTQWRLENKKQILKRDNFAKLLEKCLQDMDSPKILKNSFRKCGLLPFDVEAVDFTKCLNTNQNMTLSLPHQTAETEAENNLKDRLKFIEGRLGEPILEQFYTASTRGKWEGEKEYSHLFKFWLDIHNEVETAKETVENMEINQELICDERQNEFENRSEKSFVEFEEVDFTAEEHNSEIETENLDDCIVLEGDWINDILNESQNSIETCQTVQSTLSENTSEEIDLLNDKSKNKLEKENKDKIYNLKTNNEQLEDKNKKENEVSNIMSENLVLKDITTAESNKNNNIISATEIKPQFSEIKCMSDGSEGKKVENNIPSPFKSVLFWPNNLPATSKFKKPKERLPYACTSEKWKAYYRKKEADKAKKEQEINERKRKREETKAKKEEEKSQKITKVTKTKSKIDATKKKLFEEKDKAKNTSRAPLDVKSLNVDDYVIVQYEINKYPGVIKKITKANALVSVMESSGLNKWKWPSPQDELEYDFSETLEKIEVPKPANNRNLFFVPEIEKYRSFLL